MKPTSIYGRIIMIVLRIFTASVVLFPLLYAVTVSFMSLDEIFLRPPKLIPSSFALTYYAKALHAAPLIRFAYNSLVVSAGIMFGQLALCSAAAFSFAYFQYRGKNIIFIAMLATMMIPGESIVISNYMTIGDLGWYDTFQALILPGTASAVSVFFLRQAFLGVPKELYEAARIDGCSNFRYLVQMLIPLSKTQLGALGIYTYIGAWNQYLWPLLITNKANMRTVQIGISMLQNSEALAINMVMAGVTIILLPSIIIFILGQKQIISGTFTGAIKG